MINKMDELHQIETAWLRLYISVESENPGRPSAVKSAFLNVVIF